MANNARAAVLRALIEGVVTDLLVMTNSDNVYMPDGVTTLSAKLAEIITALNQKTTEGFVTGKIDALRKELMGDVPVEAYNTFAELAQYIEEHQEAADALTEAIGNKADKNTVEEITNTLKNIGSMAYKSVVSESDLDTALKAKVNAASEGNHSHNNKDVLDGITAERVTAWDGKGKFYAQKTQPSTLTVNDLWAAIF